MADALQGAGAWQYFLHTAAVKAEGAHGKAGRVHHLAALKGDHLGAGPAHIHKDAAFQVQLLHGSGVAQLGLLLATEHRYGKAGGLLQLPHRLVRVGHVAQRRGGNHRHPADVQQFQRPLKFQQGALGPGDAFAAQGTLFHIARQPRHDLFPEQYLKIPPLHCVKGQADGV